MERSMQKAKGFTLIELIVVIVILGIMAAIAGPRFVNLQSDARISVINGVAGAVRSAATLAYSKSLIEGEETAATGEDVVMAGNTVDTIYGYPSEADLADALDLSTDVAYDPATGVFSLRTNCTVQYNEATLASAGPPIVVNGATVSAPVTTGC